LAPARREAVRAEKDLIATVLAPSALDPIAVRRAIRAALPAGRGKPQPAPQRDPVCMTAFARAEVLAQARGAGACGVLDLLAALMERPSPSVLTAMGDPARLRQALEAVRAPIAVSPSTTASPST